MDNYQLSIKQPTTSKECSHPEEQGGSSDSDFSQLSESESSDDYQQCLDGDQNNSGQLSSSKQPATSKEASNPEEQGGSSDSGFSQLSESESSDNNEDDCTKPSQSPLEEQTESREKSTPTINSSSFLNEKLGGKPESTVCT